MARLKVAMTSVGLFLISAIGTCRADDAPAFIDNLNAAGINPVLTYEGDAAANTSGGERRGETYSGNLHVQLMFDGGRLAGIPGLSAYLDGLWINGGQPSKLVGDAQGVSSIAAPPALRLYEAWLQYNIPDKGWSILAGRYDLNTEFDRLGSAGLFNNSSFGIGPEFGLSGFAGPSIFPDPSLGLRLDYKPSLNSVFRAAILDAAPLDRQNGSPNPFDSSDGVLVVAEAAWLTRPSVAGMHINRRDRIGRHGAPIPYDDKIAVGAWYYSTTFSESAAGQAVRHRGEEGAYLLVDQLLLQSGTDPARRLTGFLQLGVANQVVDRFGSYIGTGLALSGLVPGRPDDELGLAVAMARNSSAYLDSQEQAAAPVSGAETVIELTYLAQVASWIALQPDAQYVIHPNTNPRLRNALVAQMRFELTF